MEEAAAESLGYTTQAALRRLRADISQLLRDHLLTDSSRLRFVSDIISISSEKVLLSGVAYSITFLYILCLVLTYLIGDSVQADLCLLLEALFLLAILVVNFLVAVNEDVLRRKEIPNRIKHVIATLDEAASKAVWRQQNYPHLCAPFSPCVTLQWTYRDGMIVNLPWALLVRGDVVVLRPGQELPGRCVPLNTPSPDTLDCAADAPPVQPPHLQKEKFTRPRMRVPHKNRAYRMLETPCLSNLRLALEQAQDRPITVYNKQRYLCTVKLMEGVVLPLVISLVVVASVVRHIYVLPGVALWTEIYFLQTIAASLPLLQIVFPLAWVTLNCYGMARFKLLSESKQKLVQQKSCSLSEDASDPLLEVLMESNLKTGSLKALAVTFFSILVGREDMVTRTSNIIHVLGSLSALCCVDKKGILSWPNPTAEKVFFLRNANSSVSRSSSKTSLVDSMDQHSQTDTEDSDSRHRAPRPEPNTVAEVLDLTHDQNAPFSVEFDDQAWREHILRLKPLGLAALLNTCAPTPRHIYSHFCAHLTCEAQLSEDLVPVTNRRCLCELAKQIGFDMESTENYVIKECLAVFRHLQADTIRRETRFARSLHLSTRVKVPLPHMLATVVADPVKALQLLSQGTADIVLDSCSDYWDGSELTPLSPSDRKKVLDFYQRSSLTAYCTAFAYKPLEQSVEHGVASMYLELPADCRHLYPSALENWSDHASALAYQFHSTDALLYNSTIEKEDASDAKSFFNLQSNQVFIGMVTMQYQAQSDMVELVERLERACVRFVHFSKENELRSRVFSEKMGLESGWNCHISLMSDHPTSKPASPLSSQYLPPCSEKRPQSEFNSKLVVTDAGRGGDGRDAEGYGAAAARFNYSNMESSKALSMSAPGAINLDHTTVKFDSETKRARHSIPAQRDDKMACGLPECAPAEWELEGGAEGDAGAARGDSPGDACRSLSCLTDSTDHSAPLNFDMSNRAKLPRGIDNIRPHIEQVDNVPLLVSLFTDCTAASACRMIRIMQDYSEVVCVIGSAANRDNMHIFMRADASIAVEPLYPVVCQEMPPYQVPTDCVGPIDLARALNAVPCSISNTRDSDISLFSLITMSRHFTTSLWNATQFWMCCVCSLSLLQVGSLLGFLPLCLSVGGAVWSGVLVTPALSAALTFAPLDPLVMQRAATHTRHYANIDKQVILFVFWCYGCKFIPSILSILALYGATLRSFCEQVALATGSTACTLVYPINAGNNASDTARDLTQRSWHGWGDDFYEGYYLAQHIALILVTVHLIIISMSFVDRNASIWHKFFWSNKVWSVTVVVVLIVQCVFSAAMLSRRYGLCENWDVCELRYRVPWTLLFGYVLSPTLVFCLNEFIKWQEIKANLRYQRRARLDFGTKLGMNSPF